MKKGEMSIGLIIALVLGVIILSFSTYAIVTNKLMLHNKIDNSASKSTLDDLVLICNSEAKMDKQSNFCCSKKTLKTEELNQEVTCGEFAEMEISNNRIIGLNCEEFIC